MAKFLVEGGVPLHGSVKISGSKNAALPLLCAALLTEEKVTLTNVPDIADIHTLIEIFGSIGVRAAYAAKNTVSIEARKVSTTTVTHERAMKMRGSILMFGPLLGRFGHVQLPYPGGCVIGKRPVDSHLHAMRKLGAEASVSGESIVAQGKLKGAAFAMSEMSVTATENAILAAVLANGKSEIRMAAMEPHVADLCDLLVAMGAKIEGIGTPTIRITGVKKLSGTTHAVTPDYLEAATFLVAGIVTRGRVRAENVVPEHLDAFLGKLDEIGVRYEVGRTSIEVHPTKKFHPPSRTEARPHPGFATDIMAPYTVLLSQCNGVSKIFETLYEGRLNYLFEMEKMGAKVEILNPHQALIVGPCKFRGTSVSSLDLRAGATMVLAGLIAKGTTEVNNIVYIDRGYENFEGKLAKLGAKIRRVE